MTPEQIAGLRRRLVKKWLQSTVARFQSVYSETRKYRQRILSEGAQFLAPAEDERRMLERLQENILAGHNTAISFLVSSLYLFPHQLPPHWHRDFTPPEWLWDEYFSFLLSYPVLFREPGEAEAYLRFMESYLKSLLTAVCDHPQNQFWVRALTSFVNAYNANPLYFSALSVKKVFTLRADLITQFLLIHRHVLVHDFRPVSRDRLRIGFLKESFLPHSEAIVTLPAFEHLDKTRFETFLYVLRDGDDPFTKRCYQAADQVKVIPAELNAAAGAIRSDDLDVLVVGSNVTMIAKPLTFLASHRLARTQATIYTSPVTTGMEHMDYYVSGSFSEPQPNDHYSERLHRLRGAGFCFTKVDEEAVLPTGGLLERQLLDDVVVFASAANYFKLSPDLLDNWMMILASVPDSILLLYPFSAWAQSYPLLPLRLELVRHSRKHGVTPDRIRVMPIFENQASLKLSLKQADVYLDSFPYTSSCSLTDPLDLNIPVVVMKGPTLRNAMASAIVQDLGLTELVADNWQEYRDTAIKLAKNTELRKDLQKRIGLRFHKSKLFDSRDYSQQMAEFFEQAAAAWKPGSVEAG